MSSMDHSLSHSASAGVLTAGHRRSSAESLSERSSPFKDTGQSGAHAHKVVSLAAMNAAKQEAATNGNHSPVTGKSETNPIWNRFNGFQTTPASLALQSKNVPALGEARGALSKPKFNGTMLMAELDGATSNSLGQCKSDNLEANGRLQSESGAQGPSRTDTLSSGLRYPPDTMYTRNDQLIAAQTGQSVDTNSSGKSDISSQSRASEVISPFLHIPLEGSSNTNSPSIPQTLIGQLGSSATEAGQTNNPIELTSSCEVSGDNGVPPLTSPEDSEPKSMKACSVKLVDISGGMKKEPSPPRTVVEPKVGLPGQNVPSRESLKRESPNSFKRSTCEPIVKKLKDEQLPSLPTTQQQQQPQQPRGQRNSSPNSSKSVPVGNQRDPIATPSSSSAQASTLSSSSKEKDSGLDQSYKSKWHLKEDNSLPTSTNNGSPLKTSSSSNTIESKVTISPVRKESKSGLGSSGQPGGSVTITKLSGGSSQRMESKDMKKQTPMERSTASTTSSTSSSSSSSLSSQPMAASVPNRSSLENGHHTSGDLNPSSSVNKAPRKSAHSYSVEMQRKKDKKSASVSGTPLSTGSNFPSGMSSSGQSSMAQVKKPRDEVCNSCKVEFSTREALHLHTCNSKLDQHYLTENQVRASEARRGDKSANSSPRTLSRNNSRSNSPISQNNSSSNSSANVVPSHLQSSSAAKPNQRIFVDSGFKLVNTTKDELMIEGRPKITVSKVVGSAKTPAGEDPESRKPIIPKIKLSASVNAKGSSAGSSPVATPTLPPPQPMSSMSSSSSSSSPPESRTSNPMLDSSPLSNLKRKFGDNSTKLDTPSFNGKIKLKIPGNVTNAMSSSTSSPDPFSSYGSGPAHSFKDSGSSFDSGKIPPSSARNSESNIGQQYQMSKKKEEETAGYAFAFAGRPTYSPSRIEPSSSHIPEKESPRDASNKDSPASQADSGVFSIASSNSPSKGESANSGTSPDSPTRYSDVQWKPPGSKTTVTTPTESPNGSGPTQSLASLNSSAPFNQSASNQNSISTNTTFPSSSSSSSASSSMGMAASSNPTNQQMPQGQQQHHPQQQPQPHNPYLNMYGDFNPQQQQQPAQQRDPGFNRQSPMYSAHQRMFAEQQMQQRQAQPPSLQAPQSLASPGDAPGMASKGFFPGQAFFNSSNEPPVKRKRGRPRKNPMKEPGAPKRTYNRKKKTAPAIEGNSDSVYNFDEEEQDGLLPMRPRKAPSAQQQQAKKFPFGTDEDMPKGLKMGGIARGNGNGGPTGAPNHLMGGYPHNSMQMSMQQQQQYMMNQNRHNMNPHMQHQQQQHHMQQQQQQQHPQHQNMSNENSQDCSYSSEVLKEGVGIKLKIRKEPIKNENSNSNSSFLEQQQQQQQQMQQQPNKQEHQLQQQQQQQQQQQIQHRQTQSQQMLNRQGQQVPFKRNDPVSYPGQGQQGTMNYEQMQQQHQMRMSASQTSSMSSGPVNSSTPSAMGPVLGSGNVPSPAMTSPAHPPTSRIHNPGSVESNHAMSPNPMNHQSPYHHMNSPSNPIPTPHQQISSQMHSPSQNSGNFGQVGVSPHSQQHGASGAMSNFNQGQMSHPMQSPYNGMNGSFPNGAPISSRYRMPGAVTSNYQEMNSEISGSSGFYGQPGNNFGNMPMNSMGSNGMSGYGAMNHQRFGMNNSQYHGPHNYPQQMRQMGNNYANEQFGNMYGNQGQFPGMGFNNPRMGMGHHQGQGGMMGHGGNMGHNMHHHQFRPNMGMGPGPMNSMGNVGSPRISPNHPNMPMPGVGMPRVSPSMANRQPTPLVSPQSDNSPASHQNPLTPGSYHQPHTPSGPSHYGGPITPVSNHNPMTPANSSAPPPQHHHHHPPGSVSPMTPNNPRTPQNFGGPHSQAPSSMVAPSPKQEPLVSPAPAYDDLASPSSSGVGNLRKIRRPSKPNQPDPPSISPRAEVKADPLPVKVESTPPPPPPKPEPSPPKVEEPKIKNEPPAAQAPKPKPKQLGPKPQHKYLDIPAPIYEEKKVVVKVKKEIEKSDFVARWSELPPKALRHLFRCGVANEGAVPFLVRVSRVCKSWNKEAMDPTIWTHLDLSAGKMKEKYRNDKKLEAFLKKYPNVLELKLTGWKNSVGTSTLKMISMVCPKLISLGLASCFKLSNEDVKLIAESYEKLERIDLSNVSSSSCSSRSAVSSSCLTELVTLVGKRLTHFNISNNKMAGLPFVFKALTSHSSNLEEIDISNITTTSREAIPMNVEKFQKSCPKLRVLNANHTMLNLTENPIKEQIQSPGFPFLQELHIAVDSRGYFEGMDDAQIERILKKSDKLKTLDIRGCQHVSDSCLIRLPTWEMEKLILSGCSAASASSDGLELMVKKWAATLVEMDVSFTPGERTVNFMVDEFVDANEFSIKKLNLSGTAIKLKSLTKLLKKCDTLEYINLNSCRGLPRGMKRLHGTREALLKLKEDIEEGKFNEDDSDD